MMTNIHENPFETAIKLLNAKIKHMDSLINAYLENIMNAPSTINRILTYYAIGFDPAYPNKTYIMFGGLKIREYTLVKPSYKGGII